MPRLLITGGTGYLGQMLVRLAGAAGWQVVATYCQQQPWSQSNIPVEWVALDVRDPAATAAVVAAAQPVVVIHTAFRQYEPDLYAVTARGAGAVAAAAAQAGARLVHLSSDVVFDGKLARAYREDDPLSPINDYGQAKADAEQFVLTAAPAAVIVRTSLIYGFTPLDRHTRFVFDLIDGVQSGQLFRDEIRCPVLVDDLAAALLELAAGTFRGVLHVAGSDRLSRYEFGVLLARFHGRDPARLQAGLAAASGLPRPLDCALDLSRSAHVLHTQPRGATQVLTVHS